ncbi:permease [Granulosicoccaceae sp. 1_MG-2023]|nr:permease [Granulosicoccaceae sp. 1_MG-2023]
MSPALQETLRMFVFLALELSLLFLAISFLVGVLQRHIPPARIEAALSASRRRSYMLAALLGAITPFCSCSTIPMLKGLIRARAGFGPMMVFLFSSPLLNPVIVVLLWATFGFNLTAIYVLAALTVSVAAGWSLQQLGFERHIRADADAQNSCSSAGCADTAEDSNSCCDAAPAVSSCCEAKPEPAPAACCAAPAPEPAACCASPATTESDCCASTAAPPATGKYHGLWRETWADFVSVLPYLLAGIAIGSVIYGFMPTGVLERYAGPDNPLAIPFAAVIGVPLYIRAEAVIPLAGALMSKGVAAGTVLALIIGSAGASLTELILLRSLFNLKLIAAFVGVIFTMAIVAGYATFLFY